MKACDEQGLAQGCQPAVAPEVTLEDRLEIEIDGLASDGRGVGRREGLVFFVSDTLPGQRVLARVCAVRKRLVEAELLAVLSPSPDEQTPPCPHAAQPKSATELFPHTSAEPCTEACTSVCGGCPWQGLRYRRQLFWKAKMLEDALQRVGHITAPPLLPVIPSPAHWGYRNKMAFAFAPAAAGITLGLRERASHAIVPVTGCLMQSERTMQVVAAMREICAEEKLTAWDAGTGQGLCRFLLVREETGGGENVDRGSCLVEMIVGPEASGRKGEALGRRIAARLRARMPSLGGFVLSRRAARTDVAYGETRLYGEGQCRLTERIGPLSLELGHDAFFQVNTAAAALLYAEIARLADVGTARNVWDLYCGVGSIGLYLALSGQQKQSQPMEVTGIESMPGGVAMARRNAEALGLVRSRFLEGDVARLLGQLGGTPDVIVVDPPRAGLAAEVTQALLRKMPQRLVYVSCNPASLARDAARLAPRFSLQATRPVDLFPQTPHVESVSLFCPR